MKIHGLIDLLDQPLITEFTHNRFLEHYLSALFAVQRKEMFQGAVHEKETAGNVLAASFFIEAHCPDTTRFVHSQLWQAWQRLFATNRIVWTVVPFGKARCLPRGNSDFR